MKKASVTVRAIKITVPLQPESLPREGVPMDGPIGDVEWEIALEGGALQLGARFNGKNYRRMLKTIDANGGNASVILQGTIKAAAAGQPLALDSAGFQVLAKAPRPEAAPVASSVEGGAPAGVSAPGEPARSEASEAPQAPAPLPGTALSSRRIYVPPPPVPRRR